MEIGIKHGKIESLEMVGLVQDKKLSVYKLDERYGRDVIHRVSTQSFPPTKHFSYLNNNYR